VNVLSEFGKPFEKYSSFEVAHISLPGAISDLKAVKDFGVQVDSLHELSEFRPASSHMLTTAQKDESYRVVTQRQLSKKSKEALLSAVTVGVAPVARVYAITDINILSDAVKKELSDDVKQNLKYFNYYVVELGLNVAVGQEAKIPDLRFDVDLFSDGDDRTDVTTNSVAPADSMREIIKGTVKIGLDKLLKLIPVYGPMVSDIISITPIEFNWALKKYNIDCSGPLNYKTFWRIYETDNVQSFNPLMVLKAKKNLTKIYAKARVTYALKAKGFFTDVQVYSDEKQIKILPYI
jgi:hypothetical protein